MRFGCVCNHVLAPVCQMCVLRATPHPAAPTTRGPLLTCLGAGFVHGRACAGLANTVLLETSKLAIRQGLGMLYKSNEPKTSAASQVGAQPPHSKSLQRTRACAPAHLAAALSLKPHAWRPSALVPLCAQARAHSNTRPHRCVPRRCCAPRPYNSSQRAATWASCRCRSPPIPPALRARAAHAWGRPAGPAAPGAQGPRRGPARQLLRRPRARKHAAPRALSARCREPRCRRGAAATWVPRRGGRRSWKRLMTCQMGRWR